MITYSRAHARVRAVRGSASGYICRCGEPAEDWAYQHSAGDEEIRTNGGPPYSLNLDDYAPMCRACHIQFDTENDIQRQARRADPAFREAMRQRGEDVGTLRAVRMGEDPTFDEQMRDASRRGARTVVQRMLTDKEFGTRLREVRRRNNTVRRRCDECGFISSPAGMGNHQRSTGHKGYERVDA